MAEVTATEAEAAYPKKAERETAIDIPREINSINRSVKVIEEKLDNARRKVQINEESMLATTKKQFNEIRIINSEITEIKRDIDEIKEKIKLIVKELKLTAKLEDISVLQKYLELWEPANFITRNEFEKRLEEIRKE